MAILANIRLMAGDDHYQFNFDHVDYTNDSLSCYLLYIVTSITIKLIEAIYYYKLNFLVAFVLYAL